ncbi:MAG: hypothetical protein JO353_02930 [Phycisphaerae bacterium]|nr:hypothetical protein [Phycisphaerae bacterium]
MITDLSVVEDPTRTFNPITHVGTPLGKWTFGYLIQQMCANAPTIPGAAPITPESFVRSWLMNWQFAQSPNFNTVNARPNITSLILNPWIQSSGGGTINTGGGTVSTGGGTLNMGSGTLDMAKAPFKLLAIVNRIDLSDNVVYGGGSGGEARFVFGALGPGGAPLPFTVIFEYGITVTGCADLKNWGQQWANLSTISNINSDGYRNALEAITEQFVRSDTPFGAGRPNHSALNQLRTNEVALGNPWELREFHLVGPGMPNQGLLAETVVKQTPISTANGGTFNNSSTLADFINGNVSTIMGGQPLGAPGTDTVPLQFPPSTPFAAGSSLNPIGFNSPTGPNPAPGPANMFWNAPGLTTPPNGTVSDLRSTFSLQTCNACHGGETNTSSFLHVAPAAFGQTARLSNFLTGVAPNGTGTFTVNDPAGSGTVRAYNDLLRRETFLEQLLAQPCVLQFGGFLSGPRRLPPPGDLSALRTHMAD